MKYDLYWELNPLCYFEKRENNYMNKRCKLIQNSLGIDVGSEREENIIIKKIATEEGKKEIKIENKYEGEFELIEILADTPEKKISIAFEFVKSDNNERMNIGEMIVEFEHGVYAINDIRDNDDRQILSYYNKSAVETTKKLSGKDKFNQLSALTLGIVPDAEVDISDLNDNDKIEFFSKVVKSKKEKIDLFLYELLKEKYKTKTK